MRQLKRNLFALPFARWTNEQISHAPLCSDMQIASRSTNAPGTRCSDWQLAFGRHRRLFSITFATLLVSLSLLSTGCHSWSPGSQIRQCQLESDRLLAEFRAQKKRSDELEAKLAQEQDLRAEAEKQLARLQNGSRTNTMAGRSNSINQQDGFASRTTPSRTTTGNGGPSPGNMSNSGRSPNSLISSPQNPNVDSDIQWRPKGAPIR